MFLSILKLIPNSTDEDSWVLAEQFSYQYNETVITVPAGYITNLASTPKIIWGILPPFGYYSRGAVVHDWLYSNQGNLPTFKYSRKDADKIFYTAMLESSVNKFKAQLIYRAVRLFGWSHWKK